MRKILNKKRVFHLLSLVLLLPLILRLSPLLPVHLLPLLVLVLLPLILRLSPLLLVQLLPLLVLVRVVLFPQRPPPRPERCIWGNRRIRQVVARGNLSLHLFVQQAPPALVRFALVFPGTPPRPLGQIALALFFPGPPARPLGLIALTLFFPGPPPRLLALIRLARVNRPGPPPRRVGLRPLLRGLSRRQ